MLVAHHRHRPGYWLDRRVGTPRDLPKCTSYHYDYTPFRPFSPRLIPYTKMASDDFISDVSEDVVSGLATAAITALFKGGLRVVRDTFSAEDTPVEPGSATWLGNEDELARRPGGVERLEYFRERRVQAHCDDAAACAEDFLACLRDGDHDRAYCWCEPTLLHDGDRRTVMLETLARRGPREWECRAFQVPPDAHINTIPWIGVDYDVFLVSGRKQARTLLVWLVRQEEGWAIWNVEWGPRRAE